MTDLRRFKSLAKNWEALGESDPLFGVLSDPTKIGGRWDGGEFFASGRAHVEKLLWTLADVGAAFEPHRCLDFGCGVGRLTIPLSRSFQHTIGVDVARPMIETARRYLPPGERCEFVLSRDPDLRRFDDSVFDMVHSCLVLQHIPPDISLRYIAEFFRVCRPGGLVVFQMPAVRWTESELTAAHALADSGYAAALTFAEAPAVLEPSARAAVPVRVTNRGDVAWRHDIPAGRHICVGNHWLLEDGTPAVNDDAHEALPRTVAPGETVEILLNVQAPAAPGRYLLEADLVQEQVCWFAQKGSPTARVNVTIAAERTDSVPPRRPSSAAGSSAVESGAPAPPLFRRLLRRLRGGTPTFEMYTVPRSTVEEAVRAAGGSLIRAIDDNAAGAAWLSYTYVCKRGRRLET